MKPFDRQHPVRGNFGDPRTITTEPFGVTVDGSPGEYSFHNGIDIAAPVGTRVYPVVSGVVRFQDREEVIVRTRDGRSFQYWHIAPEVRVGEPVVAGRTVLGRILREAYHVHLSEIRGFTVVNPAVHGHITPYVDDTVPVVHQLEFSDAEGKAIDVRRLRGRILIAADVYDIPPIPVPGEWYDFPVTPALVRWRMTTASGRPIVPERVVADFLRTIPPKRDFWSVYAAGTYQNFPVFAHHYFWRRRGRYLFNLTPKPIDTRRLRNGDYLITVDAADVCGNRGALNERVTVAN